MRLPIELEIFFMTDETAHMNKLGLDSKISDNELKKMTFYQITAIGPYTDKLDGDRQYSKIYAIGDYFICNQTYSQLKAMLL